MIEDDACEGSNRVRFFLIGAGVKDHDALEGVARLLMRRLRHPTDAKYRIELKGPYDDKAADTYFSELMRQWRGR